MHKEPQFGVRLPVSGPLASPAAIRQIATESERLNFHHVWLHDKIAWSRSTDEQHISCGSREALDDAGPDAPPQFFESLTTLAYVAAVTSRIRIGVSVLVLPWREPIVTAKQVANIDVLSDGRLNLGVGVGGNRYVGNDRASHTTEFELLRLDRRQKYAQTRELLESMKTLWTERFPRFDGKFTKFDFLQEETEFNPKPIQKPHPPVWVGGAGPKSMAIAAELADGWIPLWLSPEDYRARVDELRILTEAAGRPPEALTIAGTFPALIARSDDEAWEAAKLTVEVITQGYSDKLTVGRVRETAFIGGSETIAARIEEYVRVGVEVFELRFIYHSIDHLIAQLNLFEETIGRQFAQKHALTA